MSLFFLLPFTNETQPALTKSWIAILGIWIRETSHGKLGGTGPHFRRLQEDSVCVLLLALVSSSLVWQDLCVPHICMLSSCCWSKVSDFFFSDDKGSWGLWSVVTSEVFLQSRSGRSTIWNHASLSSNLDSAASYTDILGKLSSVWVLFFSWPFGSVDSVGSSYEYVIHWMWNDSYRSDNRQLRQFPRPQSVWNILRRC